MAKVRIWRELLYAAAAVLFTVYFVELRFALNREYEYAGFADLIHGTAATPFQYRALVPWILRVLLEVPGIGDFASSGPAIIMTVEWIAVLGSLLAFRTYLHGFFADRISAVLSFGILYALLFCYVLPRPIPFLYPSDTPAVLFFVLGLHFLHRRRWWLFYPIFVLATFNRETTCFLTVAYLLEGLGRERPRTLVLHGCAQAVLWFGAKTVLASVYADNPGVGAFETVDRLSGRLHFAANLAFLADPRNLPFLLSSFGFAWIPALFGYRRIGNRFATRTLWVALPFVVGMLSLGNLFEIRIFGELAPVVLVPTYLVVRNLGADPRRNPARRGKSPGGRSP